MNIFLVLSITPVPGGKKNCFCYIRVQLI